MSEAPRHRAEDWRVLFLSALADTSNVSAAARRAGIATGTAYGARRADREFARDWRAALCEGYDNLEMELLHRMRSGQKPTAKTRFDNATAFRLLLAHREEVSRERASREEEDEDAVLASLTAKLEAMRSRQQSTAALMAEDAPDGGADAAAG